MSRDFLRPRMATRTEKTTGDVRTQLALLETLSRQGEGIDKRAAAALREVRTTLSALVEVEQKKLDALVHSQIMAVDRMVNAVYTRDGAEAIRNTLDVMA